VLARGHVGRGIIKTELNNLMSEYFPIVCMSETDEEFDANYSDMMAQAKDIGIDQLNAFLTETYKTLCEQFGSK
jgi:hypothetical protein